jgi:aspartate carbamoyltransferase catalytic subunit
MPGFLNARDQGRAGGIILKRAAIGNSQNRDAHGDEFKALVYAAHLAGSLTGEARLQGLQIGPSFAFGKRGAQQMRGGLHGKGGQPIELGPCAAQPGDPALAEHRLTGRVAHQDNRFGLRKRDMARNKRRHHGKLFIAWFAVIGRAPGNHWGDVNRGIGLLAGAAAIDGGKHLIQKRAALAQSWLARDIIFAARRITNDHNIGVDRPIRKDQIARTAFQFAMLKGRHGCVQRFDILRRFCKGRGLFGGINLQGFRDFWDCRAIRRSHFARRKRGFWQGFGRLSGGLIAVDRRVTNGLICAKLDLPIKRGARGVEIHLIKRCIHSAKLRRALQKVNRALARLGPNLIAFLPQGSTLSISLENRERLALAFAQKHLLGIEHLSPDDITSLLDLADEYVALNRRDVKRSDALAGLTQINMFFENSTRTQASFELAGKRLGADVMNMAMQASSIKKGETLIDTAMTLNAMHPDLLVVRHPHSGAVDLLAQKVNCAVLNAGDGRHEHPTQALLDALTIRRAKGRLHRLSIAICGDIAHSRVARSNIMLLGKMENRIRLIAPPTLMPSGIEEFGCEVFDDMREGLADVDVVMMLRLQKERMDGAFIPSEREYYHRYGLDAEKLSYAKEDAIVMHPGPMNRGVEIDGDLADDINRSVIQEQVEMGVAVRMAAMDLLARNLRASRADKGAAR